MPALPDENNKSLPFQSISQRASLIAALRDFFLADGRDSLAEALAMLPGANSCEIMDLPGLEYEFNRLFVGPEAPLAPPYASVYLEKEPRLMGETSQMIARFYEALGLKTSIAGLPPDFLGLELEACLVLESWLAESDNGDLRRASQFLSRHMNEWLPLFLGRMRSWPLSPVMANIADLIDEWLKV